MPLKVCELLLLDLTTTNLAVKKLNRCVELKECGH
jgi:hypothetical protein